MTIVPMQTQQCTDVDLRCHVIAGLGTDDSKFDQILSLLKVKANPKASPISNVGSAEADSILLELGFCKRMATRHTLLWYQLKRQNAAHLIAHSSHRRTMALLGF
jgi:hypothetical protein